MTKPIMDEEDAYKRDIREHFENYNALRKAALFNGRLLLKIGTEGTSETCAEVERFMRELEAEGLELP